jgi:hypothetical protein
MTPEIMLLLVLAAITVLGYIGAVNSVGTVRMIVSYLLASVLLSLTVIATIYHFNTVEDRHALQRLRRLEQERLIVEQKYREAITKREGDGK